MKVLIYGGGAREHALAWKIKQSSLLEKLYLCKPNDGFAELGELIEAPDFEELAKISLEKGIDLLVVGPEDPLINGIVDEFKKAGISAIGPDKKWAALEGSKSFAKEFMLKNKIPTGKYEVITDKKDIYNALEKFTIPVVLKADGLAAGKGVFIANSRLEAEATLYEYLEGKFNEASKKVLVEEFLEGQELSLICLWDGKTLLPFIPARDYKKLKEDNKGPNTGGMGSYCPVSLNLNEYQEVEKYVKKLEEALKKEHAYFTGVIYSGLMMTKDGIKILEYNMRLGDPETQPLLMHLESDLLEVFRKAKDQKLDEVELKWKKGQSFCVVIAAQGYPENPKKGGEIKNIEQIIENHDAQVFFAGVKKEEGKLVANGGRVLSICQTGVFAQKYIYDAVSELDYSDKTYRKDIGEVSLSKEVCRKNEGCCDNCGI
ncbi:MAG TPA: phosphoribosylamine--glycine ligase [Candidatus Gastranaerophilales bacterium]|nr:phosphoribosylamine--glycine ligase [Candidatus Gastranaerophilales bacterium]